MGVLLDERGGQSGRVVSHRIEHTYIDSPTTVVPIRIYEWINLGPTWDNTYQPMGYY